MHCKSVCALYKRIIECSGLLTTAYKWQNDIKFIDSLLVASFFLVKYKCPSNIADLLKMQHLEFFHVSKSEIWNKIVGSYIPML